MSLWEKTLREQVSKKTPANPELINPSILSAMFTLLWIKCTRQIFEKCNTSAHKSIIDLIYLSSLETHFIMLPLLVMLACWQWLFLSAGLLKLKSFLSSDCGGNLTSGILPNIYFWPTELNPIRIHPHAFMQRRVASETHCGATGGITRIDSDGCIGANTHDITIVMSCWDISTDTSVQLNETQLYLLPKVVHTAR